MTARPSALRVWLAAARPRTLTLSIVPVVDGAALAWSDTGRLQWLPALLALVGAVLIQLATNLHNDAADCERGGDGPDRLGPPRVTAMGLITVAQGKRAALLCFALAALAGLYLVVVGGWPILALGLLSIAAGWAYTGGPRPIAYLPLGEVFVIAFFGVGAVAGTYWLQVGHLSGAALAVGVAVGLFAAAVLLTNNHRDATSDARTGRKTLAMLVGPGAAVWFYLGLMLTPFALLPMIDALVPHGRAWMAFGALPAAVAVARAFAGTRGAGFNRILGRTAAVQMAFGTLLCVGLLT